MGDLNGLLNDPEFQKLDVPTQKQALSRVDPDFGKLSDQDFAAFKAKAVPAKSGIGEAMGSFASGFGQGINPFHGMLETLDALQKDPVGTVKSGALNILAHPYMAMARAYDAAKAGKPEEAAVHLASAFDPTGAQTEEAAVKTATPGQRLEGVGQLVGQGAGALLTAKVPGIAKTVASKAIDLVPDIVHDPAAQAATGVISPRAKNAMQVVSKIKKARDAYQEASAAVAEEAPSEAAARPILDQIAQTPGYGDKPFDKLTPAEQAHVRSIADSIEGKKPPALPPPGPKVVETGEPPYVPPQRPSVNTNGAPLRPPLATPEPPVPEQPPVPRGTPAGPVRPPLAQQAPEAFRNPETTGLQGPRAANRANVAQKIGQKIVDLGITNDQLDTLVAHPKEAATFWEAIGKVHKSGYVPSTDTIDAVRDFVKAAQPKVAPNVTSITDIPEHLKNNPAALKAAKAMLKAHVASIGDLMKEVK